MRRCIGEVTLDNSSDEDYKRSVQSYDSVMARTKIFQLIAKQAAAATRNNATRYSYIRFDSISLPFAADYGQQTRRKHFIIERVYN